MGSASFGEMNEEIVAALKISCPRCGQHVEFPAHGIGQTIDCPTCKNPFKLAAPESMPFLPPSPTEARTARGSWRAGPASQKQLKYLNQLGHVPDLPITKGEASRLIEAFEADAEGLHRRDEAWVRAQRAAALSYDTRTAWVLHEALNTAQGQLENADQAKVWECQRNRMAFWKNTFSAGDSDDTSQCLGLWEEFGRRYKEPSGKQINLVLEALDARTPDWDRFAPESFFHTLKKNFPELLR